MTQKGFSPSKNVHTWDAISDRLSKFAPSISIADYVDFDAENAIQVLDYTSEGINFVVAKQHRDRFLLALRGARTGTGKKAFEEGRWKGKLHAAKGAVRDLASSVTGNVANDSWALNASFLATKGIGFRQIWHLELTARELRMQNARAVHFETPHLDPRFHAMFEAPNGSIDLSSLHWAVEDPDKEMGRSSCNVHIDQVGINADFGDGSAITPDTPYHTIVELAFRTGLKGLVPDKVLQSVDFILPSSHENYALNFGAQVNIIDKKDLRLSVRAMCGVRDGGCDWSGAINLSGTHDLFGGK